jgi:hypothetical protein
MTFPLSPASARRPGYRARRRKIQVNNLLRHVLSAKKDRSKLDAWPVHRRLIRACYFCLGISLGLRFAGLTQVSA